MDDEPAHGFFKLIKEHRRGYELTLFWLFVSGAFLAIAGSVGIVVNLGASFVLGARVASGGLVLLVAAFEMAMPLQRFRALFRRSSGGMRYDRLRRWTQLKVSSVLLNLLLIIAAVGLLAALLARADLIGARVSTTTGIRLSGLIALAMAANIAVCFYLAMRTPVDRQVTSTTNAFFQITVLATVVFSILSAFLARTGANVGQVFELRSSDVPFYVLVTFSVAAISLFISRSLPTVYALFAEEKEFYKGRTYMSRRKSVVMPTMMAFALLFGVLLVLIVFQLGVVGLVETVSGSVVIMGVLAFIAIALMVSVAVSFSLSRSEDETQLIKEKPSREKQKETLLLSVSLGVSGVLMIMAFLVGTQLLGNRLPLASPRWLDFFSFGLLAALAPYGFYFSKKQSRIRGLEERFPDFLRDLASSRRAGLTMEAAVHIAAKGEYGTLTPEIEKMADQLSWNVPFDETLRQFGERVRTPLIERAVSLILEASRTGGKVTDVLLAAATDARELKNLETERRTTMTLYTIIVYITFLVFLVVASVLYGTFIPEILKATEAAVAQGGTQLGGLSLAGGLTKTDYRTFYMMAAIMQGLGNGLIGGMMENGNVLNGLRHSSIMVAITYLVFTLMLP